LVYRAETPFAKIRAAGFKNDWQKKGGHLEWSWGALKIDHGFYMKLDILPQMRLSKRYHETLLLTQNC
jgi:hypothetical protein